MKRRRPDDLTDLLLSKMAISTCTLTIIHLFQMTCEHQTPFLFTLFLSFHKYTKSAPLFPFGAILLILYTICTDESQQSQVITSILFRHLVRLLASAAVSSARLHHNPNHPLEGYLMSLLTLNHLTDAFGCSNYLTAVPDQQPLIPRNGKE